MILLKGVDLDCIGSDGSANEEKLTKRSWKDMVMVYCFGYSSLLGGWNTRERFSVSTNNMFWKAYATYYILSINLQKRKRKKRCRLQISILLVNNLGIHYFPLHSSSRAFFSKSSKHKKSAKLVTQPRIGKKEKEEKKHCIRSSKLSQPKIKNKN